MGEDENLFRWATQLDGVASELVSLNQRLFENNVLPVEQHLISRLIATLRDLSHDMLHVFPEELASAEDPDAVLTRAKLSTAAVLGFAKEMGKIAATVLGIAFVQPLIDTVATTEAQVEVYVVDTEGQLACSSVDDAYVVDSDGEFHVDVADDPDPSETSESDQEHDSGAPPVPLPAAPARAGVDATAQAAGRSHYLRRSTVRESATQFRQAIPPDMRSTESYFEFIPGGDLAGVFDNPQFVRNKFAFMPELPAATEQWFIGDSQRNAFGPFPTAHSALTWVDGKLQRGTRVDLVQVDPAGVPREHRYRVGDRTPIVRD